MDNLFSFPAAALSASSSTQSGASDAPAQELSVRETPISPAFEMAEQSAHGRAPSDSLSSADLHVRLKLLDERVFDVHVDRGIAVLDFRATVERVTAIPATVLRLIYRGKLLKDSALLSSYEIQDGHTIHVVAPRAGTAAAASTASSSPPSITTAFTPATTTERPDPRDVLRQRLNRLAGHSSVSTPATATASTTTERPVSRDLRARLSRMRRSPEEVRQTTEEEPQRATPSSLSDGGATRLSRVRRPGLGEPTGDAWNLAVLREALGQHSDRIPARPSNRDAATMDSLRQGNEQRQMADNDSPVDTAASMGLDATTSATEQQPNLDYLSQGILTLRTVLSTAAVPQHETQVVEEETTERQEAVESAEISSHHGEEPTQQNQVRTPTVSPRRGRRRFFVGQWLDVKDTVNQWLECTVMDMSEDKVLVHYHGWPSRWDEWLDFDSPRIAAFRTRTQHTHNAAHLSPAPSTRLPNAPGVGENDMRRIIPQIRDLMEEVLPYVDQLATLCDDESQGEDDEFDDGSSARRREELSEIAHLVAPFFDRFGRLLVDSARQLDPLLHPDLRHDERRRRLLRARGSAPSRQTTPAAPTVPVEDSAVGIRDLITPATRLPQEAQNARRSIDVHIHAIVAPSSLSSLASLARLGTAIAGAMGSSSRSNSPALEANPRSAGEIDEAFGIPRLRPLQGGSGDRSVVADSHEPDEEDARYTDTSRTPLLSSFRRGNPSRSSIRDSITNRRGEADTLLRPRRPVRSSSTRLHDFLSDDFFGPSFSQDSDDMEDPVARDGFGTPDHSQDDVVQYEEIPSPRESEGDQHHFSENEEPPRIGVIPEIEELERIERGRRAQHVVSSTSEDAGRLSSASSTSSSGYPTFLEVMRRTLSGVRGFGFSSSSSSLQSEEPSAGMPGTPTTPVTPGQRATRSDSSSSSSSFSVGAVDSPESNTDHLAEARFVMQSNNPVLAFSRLRQPSSVSSIEEDLDSVD